MVSEWKETQRRSRIARIALYAVVALMLAVPIALVPQGVSAQGGEVKDITLYLHNVTQSRQVGSIATLRTMDTTMGTTELNMIDIDFALFARSPPKPEPPALPVLGPDGQELTPVAEEPETEGTENDRPGSAPETTGAPAGHRGRAGTLG